MCRASASKPWAAHPSTTPGSPSADRIGAMGRYILARILQATFVLWAAFTVSFILLQALPGDEILIKFENPDLGLSKQQIAEIRVAYGADVPLYTQYFSSLGHVLTGQFGYSIQRGVPV